MLKRKLSIIAACLIFCIGALPLAACSNKNANDDPSVLKGSVQISNGNELKADWYVFGSEREIEYSYPDGYTPKVYSDNTSVISVDGNVLTPVGSGMATVTVEAGRMSDSVDIKVLPASGALNIANKSELASAWVIGDGDKTIAVRSVFAESSILATSSDPSVVETNGLKITAKAVGEARVTVSVGKYTDTVDLVVRPALEKLEIVNKTELKAQALLVNETVRINAVLMPTEYYTARNTPCEVTSSNASVVSVDGYDIKGESVGTATVTVKYKDKQDQIDIKVVTARPTVVIDGDPETLHSSNKSFVIPAITAESTDGTPISDIVATLSDPDKMTYDSTTRTVTVTENGEYGITFTVADKADGDNKASVTLPLVAYRNVFKSVTSAGNLDASFGFVSDSMFADDAEQKLACDGYYSPVLAQFDMPASKVYYAETKFLISKPEAWVQVGMSHSPNGENGKSPLNWLVSYVDRAGSDSAPESRFMTKDIDIYNDSSWSNAVQDHSVIQIQKRRGIRDLDRHEVTIATARINDFFYWFINGEYAGGCTDKDYVDKNTCPGIYGYCVDATVTLANIEFIDGDAAIAKFNEITDNGNKLFVGEGYWTDGSALPDGSGGNTVEVWHPMYPGKFTQGSDANSVGFTFNNYVKGDSGDDASQGAVTPYIWFDGDFTFEWTFKMTNKDPLTNDWGFKKGAFLALHRPRISGDSGSDLPSLNILLGAQYHTGNANGIAGKVSNIDGQDDNESNSKIVLSNFDQSQGARFKITRTVDRQSGRSTYTLTITSVANPTQTHTETVVITAEEDSFWDSPVMPYFKTARTAGEYSDIVWSANGGND